MNEEKKTIMVNYEGLTFHGQVTTEEAYILSPAVYLSLEDQYEVAMQHLEALKGRTLEEDTLQDILTACFYMTRELNAKIKGIDARIKSLNSRKARLGVMDTAVRSFILAEMVDKDVKQHSTIDGEINLRPGKTSLTVVDETKLPAWCKLWKQVIINKNEIKKILKTGIDVPGVEIVTGDPIVEIQ